MVEEMTEMTIAAEITEVVIIEDTITVVEIIEIEITETHTITEIEINKVNYGL